MHHFLSFHLSVWVCETCCAPPFGYRTTLCTTDLHCAPPGCVVQHGGQRSCVKVKSHWIKVKYHIGQGQINLLEVSKFKYKTLAGVLTSTSSWNHISHISFNRVNITIGGGLSVNSRNIGIMLKIMKLARNMTEGSQRGPFILF